MPLLGKKIFSRVKPLTDVKPDESIFTIPHTEERFRSREEYDKRLHMYSERIWTCQCTGHTNLSHEEAVNSEKAVLKTLKAQYSPCYEKSVLELVHHSTLSLDTLVDQSWLKLQQCLSLNENVSLKIKTTEKCLQGAVMKVDINGVEANPTNNCSSPSSDKENAADAGGDSPKKWVPPKLLPYKYSIKLEGADKVINDIPAADLTRCDRPPSKELLRLFIRSNALRVGPTQPWVVDDKLVKKYKLPSKFVDFLLSPAKMAENIKLAEEKASAKKRKSTSKPSDKSDTKKAKVPAKKSITYDKKQKKLNSPSIKKRTSNSSGKIPKSLSSSAKASKSNDIIEIYSDSDDEALINFMPLSVLKEGSPKKGLIASGKTPPSSAASTPRKRGRPRKDNTETTPKKRQSLPNKTSKKNKDNESPSKRKKTPTKSKKIEESPNKRVSPRKRKKPDKTMKQITLFDIKGQKTPTKRSPDKRKAAPTPPRTPWIVTRILKAKKEGNKVNFNMLTTKAAKDLTAAQRGRLPEEIKDLIVTKYDKLEEKKKLKKMTPAEREAYLQKKKEERKKKLADRLKAKNMELRKRYEDQDLELKPIPAPKLVPTPDGLPNELFGEIAMVTEFISCYAGLLMPEEEYPIQSDALMKALASGSEGFAYLSRVLKILLHTLLQDGIAEYYSELDTSLSDIAVTPYTSSELVRLCLRKQDDEAADNDVDHNTDAEEEDSEVAEDIIQALERIELYELTADQKLKILKGLCLRIMGSYSIQDYMEERQKEASKLWRQKTSQFKTRSRKRGDKKEEEEKPEEKAEEAKPATDTDLTIAHFYGKKGNGTAESTPEPEPSNDIEDTILAADPADIDLAGVVKRRRVLAARAAAEKVVKEKEDKIRREKEAIEYKKQREMESFEKSFSEGIALAKLVLRQSPIGTDRNHNRYWVFTNTTPGLFVEKGWVTSAIGYNYKQGDRSDDDNSSMSSDDDDDDDSNGKNGSEKIIETTFPNYGQNLWFMYDSVKDFDALLDSLHPNGVRENALKAELKKRYHDIVRAINSAKRTNNELRDSDGEEEMLAGFKKELFDLENRLRNGGLGGVPDLNKWEARVLDAKKIEELGACLNECQLFTMEKFLKGIFVKKEKKGSKDTVKSDPGDGDVTVKREEEDVKETEQPQTAMDKWREGLETAQTLSRLHVLMGIFDSSIKWEKSAENAKCKICRKKGEDNQSLLCDDCNQAFHLYCLRPALPYIPDGEWFCPACRPQTQRRRPVPGTYRDMNGESSEDTDDEGRNTPDEEYTEEIQHDENCLVCGGDEGLVFCCECPSAFHLDCHVPPLRHTPRSNWTCSQCKTGVKIKSKRRHIPVPTKKRRKCYDVSSDDDEEESNSSEDEEEASDAEILPTSRRRGKAAGTPAMRSVGTTTSDIEKVIIPTKYKPQQKRTESRRSEPTRRADSKKTETRKSEGSKSKTDEEEEEDDDDEEDDVYTGYLKPSCKRGPSDLSLCEQILGCLFRHKSSWPFQSPVNKKEVPDYHTIIKKPMDFQTIKNNILCFVYSTTEQFVEDVALVFRNAAQYNKIDSEVYTCMLDMEECFTELLRKFLPECRYERETTLNGYDQHGDPSKRPRRI